MQSGAIAGAVALVRAGDTDALTTAGVQDRKTGAPMLLTRRQMTGADDAAMATELGRIVFPAAANGECCP